MVQHTNGSHLEEGINTYLTNHNIGPLVQETIISHTRNSLIHNNHPRHELSLATLREVTARHKKWTNTPEADKGREKISFDYTLEAIEKMQKIGLSQETISAIIDSLYELSLNYRNSRKKIRSLWKITFEDATSEKNKSMVDRRHNQRDLQKNIENNIWWECDQLAVAYRDIFHKKWISRLIKDDLTDRIYVGIRIIDGFDRKYFTKKSGGYHLFCLITIWEYRFVFDPSLGEINIFNEWWYIKTESVLQKITTTKMNDIDISKIRSVMDFKTSDNTIRKDTEWRVSSKYPEHSSMFLWRFDNTNYMFSIGFAEITKGGKKYPIISLKNFKERIIWTLDDNKDLRLDKEGIPDRLKERMKEHLLILDSITQYN